MKRIFLFGLNLLIILILAGTGTAQDLKISGQYRGEFEMSTDDSSYAHQHWMNMVLEKSLGQDARMHLDLELNNYGSENLTPLLQEAYVDYYTNDIDWRFGKQIISWGSGYEMNPTSFFNPFDLTVITPGEKRLGVIGGSATYYAPDRFEISAAFVPFFDTHLFPENVGSQLLEQTVLATSQQIDLMIPQVNILLDSNTPFVAPEVPSTVVNSSGGIQITKRGLGNFDVSVSGYHGHDKMFMVDETATMNSLNLDPENPGNFDRFLTVHFFYPEVNRAGFDIIGTLGNAGIWLEGTRSWYNRESLNDALNIVGGLDYRFSNDMYLIAQGIYTQGRTDNEQDVKAVMAYITKPVFGFHEIELVALYEMESESYFVQPQLNYSLGNAVGLEFGGTLMDLGNEGYSSLFSQLIGERLYARLTVDF